MTSIQVIEAINGPREGSKGESNAGSNNGADCRWEADMNDLDAALTDFVVAALCFWFVVNLARQRGRSTGIRDWWALFFIGAAVASLSGGIVHAFFLDDFSLGHRILWPAALLALGFTASCAWVLVGIMLSGGRTTRSWIYFSAFVFLIHAVVVVLYSHHFVVAIANYLQATFGLLVASLWSYYRTRSKPFLWILAGVGLTFIAAYIQRAKVAIHAEYFDFNSTYHFVQALGLWLLYRGAKGLAASEWASLSGPGFWLEKARSLRYGFSR